MRVFQSSLYDFWVWVLVASLILCLYKMLGSLSLLASKGTDVYPHICLSLVFKTLKNLVSPQQANIRPHHPHLSQSQTPHPSGLLIISSHRSVYFNELSINMFQYKAQFINAFIISCNWEFQSWNKLLGGFIQRSLPLFFSDSLDHVPTYLPPHPYPSVQSWIKELEHGWPFSPQAFRCLAKLSYKVLSVHTWDQERDGPHLCLHQGPYSFIQFHSTQYCGLLPPNKMLAHYVKSRNK